MNRRGFLKSFAQGAVIITAAPAIVRFDSLMKLPPKRLIVPSMATIIAAKRAYGAEVWARDAVRRWDEEFFAEYVRANRFSVWGAA